MGSGVAMFGMIGNPGPTARTESVRISGASGFTFSVPVSQPGGGTPQIAVTPSSGPAGTFFQLNGSGFTPSGTVDLTFNNINPLVGGTLAACLCPVNSQGGVSLRMGGSADQSPGVYEGRVVDLTTGRASNVVRVTIQ